MNLQVLKRTKDTLDHLASMFEKTVAELVAEIEAGRSYFVYSPTVHAPRLLALGEIHAALDVAHAQGVDVCTMEIMDLSGVPDTLRRAAAAALN